MSSLLNITRVAAAAAFLVLLVAVPAARSATVASDGATATYTGDAGERDSVSMKTIAADKVEFEVDDDTIVEGANCTEVTPKRTVCVATGGVVANLLDGDDSARGYDLKTHTLRADGDVGNDIVAGGASADELSGGAGNDVLTGIMEGPAGPDRLDGGTDDDTFLIGAEGDDVIGGPGSDRASLVLADTSGPLFAPADLTITLDDQPNDARPGDGANVHADVEHVGSYLTDQMENGFSSSWGDPLFFDEGRSTIRGTAGPNSVWGGSDDDDLDPLAGNDVVSAGIGADTVHTVDGFADRVACGPGVDALTADTLDDVSDSCENVERRDVGNANDVPDAAEDAAPTVALASGGPTLTASAADDRGISAVMFLDDDRLVCTDDTAPYTCDHRPTGEDVGRNTLTAIAVDTAQQTASDRRVVTVPRFAPADVTLRVAKRRASGRVVLPAQVAPQLGCAGEAIVAGRRARVKPDCTYAVRVKPRRRARSVRAQFTGNDVLSPKQSVARRVSPR